MKESKGCDEDSPVLYSEGISTGYALLDLGVFVVNPRLKAGELMDVLRTLIKKTCAISAILLPLILRGCSLWQ